MRIFTLQVYTASAGGCGTWVEGDYLDLREEEVTGRWRKLHNEEFHNFYSSIMTIKSRKCYVWRTWKTREGEYKMLVRNPEGKRPLERTRLRWEDNIQIDHKEIRYKDVDWIHLVRIQISDGLL
jgi:hypothetical protein